MSIDWKQILVLPNSSISEVIKVIDSGGLRLALVVDGSGILLGTVTDGDVRRGLIKHIPISSVVTEVMNKRPVVAEVNTAKNDLIRLLEKDDLLSIPLVDDGKLVGLETVQHLRSNKLRDNPVFLMAGGFGTRLQPLTDNCPKPLLKVGDKPILETILDSFISAGFHNFYISTHFLPELIKEHFGNGHKWGVSIRYIHEDVPLGTGGALGLLPENIAKLPIIMMNGDVLTKVDFSELLTFHNSKSSKITVCVREYEYQVPYGVIDFEEHRVKKIVEKPVQKYFVNAGIYVLEPSIVESVVTGEFLDMPDLLTETIDKKQMVSMFPLHEYWLDIGRLNDFERAQHDFVESFLQ